MANTPEQQAYDDELAAIEAMPIGPARIKAKDAFEIKYPNGRPGKTPEQKAAEAEASGKAFGFMKAFLDKFPNDTKLQEAWALLLENDIAGAKLAFQASDYYKNTLPTSDTRFKRKLNQPGVYAQELNVFIDEQVRRLIGAGITLDVKDKKVRDWLESSYLSGETDNQIDIKALAFSQGKPIGGTVGASIADLRSYARAFGLQYTDADYNRWSQDVFAGKTTAFDIQSKIRQDSASAFPVYSEQILNGITVDSIGSAYKSSMANILELDADAVGWTDPLLRKALQYTEDGKAAIMPLWKFEEELRRDPRWQYTNNARESVYNAVWNVGTEFGVL